MSCRLAVLPSYRLTVWPLPHYLERKTLNVPGATAPGRSFFCGWPMIQEMREKLGKEIEDLTRELTITLPQAIATAVAMGDLRENSEYKAALERQQLVQARLSQLHQRMAQISQLANSPAPVDRVGLGSRVVVEDASTGDRETYTLVLAEMMDIDAGHISLASPLGRALKDRKPGEEVSLKLPTMHRKLRVVEVVTIHQQGSNGA